MAFVLALITLGAATSHAIDAKKKSGASSTPTVAPVDSTRSKSAATQSKAATSQSLLERLKRDVRESSKQADSGKYDNYIDKNNDGVDDRVKDRPASVESTQVKESETRESHSGTHVKKPSTQTDSSASTAKKKKTPR